MPKSTVIGGDLSHDNPSVDWPTFAANAAFVSIKCTEGETLVDPKFAIRWQTAKQQGVRRNAYHFFRPDDDPAVEAKKFTDTLAGDWGEIWPTLDIENSNRPLSAADAANVMAMRDAVKATIGGPVMFYTSRSVWQQLGNPDPGDSPLWVARYIAADDPGQLPGGFANWVFWQFSESGTLAGVQGQVDLDCFNGSAGDLAAMFPVPAAIGGATGGATSPSP